MRNTRTLPVKVDGRLKIGPFTIKNFLKWIGIPIVLIIILVRNPSQNLFIVSLLLISASSIPFMEFKHRQTGLDFFKELIVYDLKNLLIEFFPNLLTHKEVHLERSSIDDSILQRFTYNKKVQEIRLKKQANLE